ncbi:MAG: dienelactone hydrolase family protein [Gammaproteobacteria bacterium]
MSIVNQLVNYDYNGKALQGYLAYDDAISGPRPLVTVSHAWGGRGDFENDKADKLAKLGYAGFAIDVYGAGVTGSTPEENTALMNPLLGDRDELLGRLRAGVQAGSSQDVADASRIAVTGYCFGGLCALDLARSGDALAGAVSFHGLFTPPENSTSKISAKVLVLHGWGDPMATPDSVVALGQEMSEKDADWQLHAYGQTLHSFTNPQANDPKSGLQYSADADRRSWQTLSNFLAEIFD